VDVRYTVGRGQAQIIFEVTPFAPYTIEEDQQHLLLKFDADALDLSLPETGSDSLVNSIQRGDELSWLTINLGSEYASFQSVLLDSVTSTSSLLVSILSAGVANEITAASTPLRPSVGETTSPLQELTAPAIVRTIVLDPGHGGDDHGVVGPNGVLEKQVTLQVAERLKRAIESRLGLRVVMTRNDDRMVRLDERAAIANNNKADLFISLHANAALSPVPAGASVSYLSLDEAGGTSREDSGNRNVSVLGGGSRNIEAVSWEMAQISHIDQSAMFAAIVDAQLRTMVDVRLSGSQGAPFRVLVGANMPAVLVELGFLSNPHEEQELTSASFQETLVQALFQSIVGFRVRVEQPIRPEVDNAFWEES
jgi:N-acetylmuramoyl-L-alanine amidase